MTNDILRWIHPTGAAIIDALLFSQSSGDVQDADADIDHRSHIDRLHTEAALPTIIYPLWYITMNDQNPFIVSYPLGCDRHHAYNVRLCLERIIEYPQKRNNEYAMSMDIRYNRGPSYRKYHKLMSAHYEKAKDLLSLCASAQATFHQFFKDQTNDPEFLMNPILFDSVSDYSCQPSILPAYNTHGLPYKGI
jgi:hypothetical protein